MSRPLLREDAGDGGSPGGYAGLYPSSDGLGFDPLDGDDSLLERDDPRQLARRAGCVRVAFAVLVCFVLVFTGVAVGVPQWLRHDKAAAADEEGPDPAPPLVEWSTNVGVWKVCWQADGSGSESCKSLRRVCGDPGALDIVVPPANASDPDARPTTLLSVSEADKKGFCQACEVVRAFTIIALLPCVAVLALQAMWRDVPGRAMAAFPAATAVCLVISASLAPRMNSKLTGGAFDYGASFGMCLAGVAFCLVACVAALGVASDDLRNKTTQYRVDLQDDAAL